MSEEADRYREILQRVWGYDDFRGIQRQIIESIGRGEDTLGLMPTGGGKSITFQVPALASDGLCLVITPLIALMKDQVASLRRRGVKAEAVFMGMRSDEVGRALDNCIFGSYKFLYVSPERLSSQLFIKKLSKMPVAMIAVDEAHCISQWGYDFRPAYLQIARVRQLFPNAPMLALTATATAEVCNDIMERLEFRRPNLIRMSFVRQNLVYVVRRTDDVMGQLLHILNRVPGSAIVYLRDREGTGKMAAELRQNGIDATSYHAGLSRYDREERQTLWTQGKVRVMVATNAFGMGIDKPDVRVVVHTEPPNSPEEYFQEAGRAGRDGQTAYAVQFYTDMTLTRMARRVAESFPPQDAVRTVYEHLCCYYTLAVNDGQGVSRDFDVDDFCVKFHHYPTHVMGCIKMLQLAGYIDYQEEAERLSRILFLVQRGDLYRLENLSPEDDELLRTILRHYGGVFSDYVFVSEAYVAERAGVPKENVYKLLIALSRRHIISYIPARNVPRITFLRRRSETSHLAIPVEVYEDRMVRYRRRIDAMMGYVSGSKVCRSVYLISYLGEEGVAPCRRCDVCQARSETGIPAWQYAEAAAYIDSLLSSGEWVSIASLQKSEFPPEAIAAHLERLAQDDSVEREGVFLRRHATK